MPIIDYTVETKISRSVRARQLESSFDVPAQEKCTIHWRGDLPIEGADWNVGLIVGPSGCGKSSILRHVFGEQHDFKWGAASIIDDFDGGLSIQDITSACQSVGFNTIPAWLRPFSVLSTGEKFRADIARRMLEVPAEETIVVDEFTSVIDRQVAQIASHAIQKFIRRKNRRMVVASCHFDIIDWLQPDWILEPATMTFSWRSLRRRPSIQISLSRINHSAWRLFAPYHYMSADLHRSAACFGLFCNGVLANFAAVLHRPVSRGKRSGRIWGVSRMVTLPDFQGIGLNSVMNELLGAAYAAVGDRLHLYPAAPALVKQYDRDSLWRMTKKQSYSSPSKISSTSTTGAMGGRPCAVFEYAGKNIMPVDEARRLIGG